MKYNIAICGTFNVDNYGDVMFPEVFKRAMKNRGLDFELFLISPGETTDYTLCPEAKVYSVSELENIHRSNPIDAIIIGGGALIHYSKIPVQLPDSDAVTEYNIYDSWYTPIEFAVRNNIKVLFNLPQVPYDFPSELKDITRRSFECVEYISLRDDVSAKKLADVFEGNCPEIAVYPDSVCCIQNVISKNELLNLKNSLLPFNDKYVVLHFNAQKQQSEDKKLVEIISKLKSIGYKVVLLPLGYTHNDDGVLNEFNKKHDNIAYIIDKKLNIFEMAAVLSDCSIYIGSSFHGAITTISYGHVAISYNYIYPKTKNREIFDEYGIGEFVAENAYEVCDILDKYLKGELAFEPKIQSVVDRVDEHFDRICDLIQKETHIETKPYNFYSSLIELLPQTVKYCQDISAMTRQIEMTENHVRNLEKLQIVEKEKMRANFEKELAAYKDDYERVKTDNELLSLSYSEIQRSFFWRATKPLRRISQSIKNFVAKRPKLLKCAIYLKGFLRGGIKGAKIQIKNYNNFISSNTFGAPKRPERKMMKLDNEVREYQQNYNFSQDIKFSILVPLYNTPKDFLVEMINSVKEQTYKNWELCLADGSTSDFGYVEKMCLDIAKNDSRVIYKKLEQNLGISENTNACLAMATGDYIALFDHDDILEPTVLFEYMKVICEQNADFIYCDEDKFSEFGGRLYDENYKPDFAIDNIRSNNYICHFSVFDKKLIEKAGAFRKEFDGSQDHDLILRLTEQAKNIVHIPKILYHWRVSDASVASDPYAKPYTIEAGKKAVAEHLERVGLKGTVESTKIHPNIYRIKYDIIGNPLVSIIIPNYNHVEELSRCIDSIISKSTYKNYEIIIVENNSDKKTFAYYDTLKKYDNIKVVVYKPEGGFNYSAINNYGVKFANGEHYILLNNDVEIITPEWIEEMLMYSQRDDIGAVGAMLYYPNDTIQHAGVTIGVLTLAGHNFKHSHRGDPGYFGRAGYQQNVSAVTAACLMLPAKVYEQVNGLDESFAVAFNDIDFCMRIRKEGYLIAFTPFAELYHYESISRGDDESPEKRARFVSEVERFLTRWKKELDEGDPYYNPNLTLDRENFSLK